MIDIFIIFFLWTLLIYWIHRLAHVLPLIKQIHYGHHNYIKQNIAPKWHWSNIFLFQDNWISTVDVWLTEVLPTILFCAITEQWWIAVLFYVWSAFIQERIEHDPEFDFLFFTSGRWHLIHHKKGMCNYGLFHSIWDRVFGTYKKIAINQVQ